MWDTSRIGCAATRPDSAQRFFPPQETFRHKIVSVRLAPVFLFVPTEFLHRSPRRRVQLLVPFNPTRETLILLLDRFRSADESGM